MRGNIIVAAASALLARVLAGDNGMAMTPPMGWRSWNQFQCNTTQAIMQQQALGMVDKSRNVNGVLTSLLDLGYSSIGVDDCWQLCGRYGPNNYRYHNATGFPQVDTSKYNFTAMTAFIHSLGLRAGWYGNNCVCMDHCNDTDCFQGDVDAFAMFGFDDWKLDACGKEKNMTRFAALVNATGIRAVLENCWNVAGPTLDSCPFHLYRISADIRPTYGSVMANVQNMKARQAVPGMIRPGCWAYADMSEVGVTTTLVANVSILNYVEARSHFGVWCVTSNPLTLSLDLTDNSTVDSVWDIITNWEAIAVNQAWAGSAGGVIYEASTTVVLEHCSWGDNNCTLPTVQQWYKPLPGGAAAVIVQNHDINANDGSVAFDSIPGLTCATSPIGCRVRDVYAHADLGTFAASFPISGLGSHDSVFITLS